MSDLVEQLQLRYGVPARQSTFTLETDERDTDRNQPVSVFPFMVFSWGWTDEEYERQYRDKEILKVRANGAQHVRLYAPIDLPVDLVATELPVRVPSIEPARYVQHIPSARINPGEIDPFFRDLLILHPQFRTDSRYVGRIQFDAAPPTYQYVGQFETVMLDSLTWENSRVAYLRYNYASAFATAYASDFVTSDGRSIDPPVFVPGLGGALVTTEPCYGAVVLRYKIPYRLYRINYGLPPTTQMFDAQIAWLRGNINLFPLPPVKVIAISAGAGRVATLDFAKTIDPVGATLASWSSFTEEEISDNSGVVLSEAGRTTETVRVTDPQDENNYIDVRRARLVTLYDKTGRPFTFRLNP